MALTQALTAVLVVVLAMATVASAASANTCTWDNGEGATFDLSFLKLSGSYSVKDVNVAIHNYTYMFNICADTAEIPQTGRAPYDACEETFGYGGDKKTGPAPAFQVSNLGNYCHRLGDNPNSVEWSQFDPYDATRGVTLKYTNGDKCGWPVNDQNRSLAIHFLCYDDGANIPDQEPVENTDYCSYEVFVRSTFGCPTACFGSNFKLCSSHGVCGYDPDESRARCFCNEGYEGTYCSSATPPPQTGMTGESVVLILVSLLLIVVLGVLGYLWMKIKTLRLDPAAYNTLGGGDEDLDGPGAGVGDAAL